MNIETQIQFKKLITVANKILIIVSNRLDLDAIASGILVKKYVQHLQPPKEVKLLFPRKAKSFEYEENSFMPLLLEEFIFEDSREDLNSMLYDTVILLDGANANQFYDKDNTSLLAPDFKAKEIIQIDHHDTDDFQLFTTQFKDTHASSTIEVLLDKIIPLDFLTTDYATLCYAGLVGDTNNFRYSFRPETLRIVASVIEKGAKTVEILNALYCRKTPEYLKAVAYVNTHIQYDEKNKTLFFVLTSEIAKKDKLSKDDMGLIRNAFTELGSSMRDYNIGILLTERDNELVIMSGRGSSLRNKISLPELYASIGAIGGGHFNAASAAYKGNVEDVMALLKQNISNFNETGSF